MALQPQYRDSDMVIEFDAAMALAAGAYFDEAEAQARRFREAPASAEVTDLERVVLGLTGSRTQLETFRKLSMQFEGLAGGLFITRFGTTERVRSIGTIASGGLAASIDVANMRGELQVKLDATYRVEHSVTHCTVVPTGEGAHAIAYLNWQPGDTRMLADRLTLPLNTRISRTQDYEIDPEATNSLLQNQKVVEALPQDVRHLLVGRYL